MKYLILGANGLIGQQFVRICRKEGIPYVGTRNSRESKGLIPFDLLDFERIPELLDEIVPTVLINAVGLAGGVNFCEANPEIGRQYHVDATRIMVAWCKRNHVPFAFISTDYVFDGTKAPYKENDPTNPLNLYGKLKLEAEQLIQSQLERCVIARTTNVFGWDPETVTPNFLMHLIQTLREQDSMKVPSFLYGNPTYAGDLAFGIMDLINRERWGLYHIVGPGYINRYDWAVRCLEIAGVINKSIEKVEHPPDGMVPRPLTSNLDTTKFTNASKIKVHDIEEGLRLFATHMAQRA